MRDPNWWTVIGLAVDVLGVFLVGLFEMTVGWATEDHMGIGYRFPTEIGESLRNKLSTIGWVLIASGFLAQIVGQFIG